MKTAFYLCLLLAFAPSAFGAVSQSVPRKATQAEVDAGVNDSTYITPSKLAGRAGGGATNVSNGSYTNVTLTDSTFVAPSLTLGGTNILYLSELLGSDTVFEWGNPAKPVKTLTNAILQAQTTFLNSKATIMAFPESYACSNHTGITFTNLDLTLLAWGATFNGWRTGLVLNVFGVGTNSVFKQIGGTYDFTSDFYVNTGHPFDVLDATNVSLFGITVRAVTDNFFWTARTPAQWLIENCTFSSAWDMNQITLTGPGTNTVFTVRNSSFTKDSREIGDVIWNAIRQNVLGVLRIENSTFNADHPGFTNDIDVISLGRTNFIKNVTISMAGSGDLQPFDSMPVNSTGRQYRFENVTVYPDNNPFNSAHPFFSFGSTTFSNITVRGGFYGGSNSVANWPAAAKTHGGHYIGNSNSAVYLLSSSPGSTTWGRTNRLDLDETPRTLSMTFVGNGVSIPSGTVGYVRLRRSGTFKRSTIIAHATGSITIDVWKDAFANGLPTDADSITDGNPPSLSAAATAEDTDLGNWSTVTGTAGEIVGFHVDSSTTCTNATIDLDYE